MSREITLTRKLRAVRTGRSDNSEAPMDGSLIIALRGEAGAGKPTTTGLLEREGHHACSLSGFLHEEAKGRPA